MHCLASGEVEVPSGYTGVDLAAHFRPCGIRLGVVSLLEVLPLQKSKPLHSRRTFKFPHSKRVDPLLCKYCAGQAGEAATSWQTGALGARLN